MLSVYVGTNDNGATDTDPTGGGATGNNMVAVQLNQYDSGLGSLDGNLTTQTLPVGSNSADNRIWNFQYDWRNRQTQVTAPQDYYVVNTFDRGTNGVGSRKDTTTFRLPTPLGDDPFRGHL